MPDARHGRAPAKKKPGRPRTLPDDATPMRIRFGAEERRAIEAAAKAAGLKAAPWVRRTLLAAAGYRAIVV